MKALSRVLFTLCLALVLDGISKIWAERTLELYQPVPIAGQFFRFTLGYNTGVAFGMFANGGLGPLVVTGLVILGLIVWFARRFALTSFRSRQVGQLGCCWAEPSLILLTG